MFDTKCGPHCSNKCDGQWVDVYCSSAWQKLSAEACKILFPLKKQSIHLLYICSYICDVLFGCHVLELLMWSWNVLWRLGCCMCTSLIRLTWRHSAPHGFIFYRPLVLDDLSSGLPRAVCRNGCNVAEHYLEFIFCIGARSLGCVQGCFHGDVVLRSFSIKIQ